MARRTALVAGGLGVIGRALVTELGQREDWEVIALSRRRPDFETRARYIGVDLLDPVQCRERLASLERVTHVFYAALYKPPGGWDRPANLNMLVNLIDAIEPVAPGLAHVSLMQGTSYYGFHTVGTALSPAKETDPRTTAPNFYYAQEDFLRARGQGKSWSFSAPRPAAVCGFAVGNPMNLALVIALHAAISRELGLPFRFPGPHEAYERLFEVTDAALLARAALWAAETPACRGQAFNVTNADAFRWCHLWPRFAAHFGIDCAPPQPISLAETMAGKGALWEAMVVRHGLRPYALDALAGWEFGDEEFAADHDMLSSNVKRFGLGFSEVIDSEAMFLAQFDALRRERIIP